MKIEKIVFTNWDNLRQFCVNNNAYTCGCNEEYTKMLDKFADFNSANTEKQQIKVLQEIANDIYNHSDEEFKRNFTIIDIMEIIYNKYSHTMFRAVE